MRTKRTKKYVDDIAIRENLRAKQVQEIVESFFRFTAQIMSEGNRNLMNFSNIRLMMWGVFKVKKGRKQHFKRINKQKNANKNRKN